MSLRLQHSAISVFNTIADKVEHMNWKHFKKRIPVNIQIGPKVFYEILWAEEFKHSLVGKTIPEYRQIILKTNETPKETVITYLHEVLHAVSDAYGVGLTENQILAMEAAFKFILKQNNILKD